MLVNEILTVLRLPCSVFLLFTFVFFCREYSLFSFFTIKREKEREEFSFLSKKISARTNHIIIMKETDLQSHLKHTKKKRKFS